MMSLSTPCPRSDRSFGQCPVTSRRKRNCTSGSTGRFSGHRDAFLGAGQLRNRMIATLYWRDGYSLRQIARAWGLSHSTVHKIARRARETLSVISDRK